MSKPEFNCDREWWNSLTDEEKEKWLDWSVSGGSERKVNLVDRNPDYPNLMCIPSISLGTLTAEEILDLFKEDK